MTTPAVTELRCELEAVSHDTFADDLIGAAPVDRNTHRPHCATGTPDSRLRFKRRGIRVDAATEGRRTLARCGRLHEELC
jgi:hypothetical protein